MENIHRLTRSERDALVRDMTSELETRVAGLRTLQMLSSRNIHAKISMRINRVPRRYWNVTIGELLERQNMMTAGGTVIPQRSVSTNSNASTVYSEDGTGKPNLHVAFTEELHVPRTRNAPKLEAKPIEAVRKASPKSPPKSPPKPRSAKINAVAALAPSTPVTRTPGPQRSARITRSNAKPVKVFPAGNSPTRIRATPIRHTSTQHTASSIQKAVQRKQPIATSTPAGPKRIMRKK